MFSAIWRRSYHWKDLRPNPKQRGWFNNNGLTKSGYPSSNPRREPGVDADLQERLLELRSSERNALSQRKDIGHPPFKSEDPTTDRKKMLAWRKEQRSNPLLEKASRERTLNVDSHIVEKDHVKYGGAFRDIFDAGELYGIYEDLFPGRFFKPNVMLRVEYPLGEDQKLPVYRGNILKPSQAAQKPRVSFPGDDKFYTLVMSTPDGHFEDESKEYLHWMVGNIHKSSSSEELVPYCRPFPPKGTGYFRYVFILYEHEAKIDFSPFKVEEGDQRVDLTMRTFSSSEFFEANKESLTPVGLSFFQSDYDSSLRDFYHNTLRLPEPVYEYEFIPSYVRPWNDKIPRRKQDGFNLHLDRHRDPKEIQEEVLRKKLAETHPFEEGDLQKPQFPLAHAYESIGSHPYEGSWFEPSWRRREIERERLRQGIYKDMDWKELRSDPTDSHA